jgi:uncharacterized coiled-coil DUF342 family protein
MGEKERVMVRKSEPSAAEAGCSLPVERKFEKLEVRTARSNRKVLRAGQSAVTIGRWGMERLEQLAKGPLSFIDRFHREVQAMFTEAQPPDEISKQIQSVKEQMFQEAEERFYEFGKEADAVEEELLKNLQQIREVRARANLVSGLVRSIFRTNE